MRAVSDEQAQWVFAPDAFDHTPSRRAGISLDAELGRRRDTVEYMKSLALRSGLGIESPENNRARGVVTVAAILIHRFYMRRSLADFSEMLMAPTILFLASKIEEEPLKLRYIVNACLAKWETPAAQWHVDPNAKDHHPPQSVQYRAWEQEILVAEELALDALCFNMDIEQPWAILKRCTAGMTPIGSITEAKVAQAGFSILNATLCTPLVVLHHPDIIAFSALVLIVAFVNQVPISQAKVLAAEQAGRFQLDFASTQGSVTGTDDHRVQACCEQFIEYCKAGLIDEALVKFVKPEPEPEPEPTTNGTSDPQEPAATIATEPKTNGHNGTTEQLDT